MLLGFAAAVLGGFGSIGGVVARWHRDRARRAAARRVRARSDYKCDAPVRAHAARSSRSARRACSAAGTARPAVRTRRAPSASAARRDVAAASRVRRPCGAPYLWLGVVPRCVVVLRAVRRSGSASRPLQHWLFYSHPRRRVLLRVRRRRGSSRSPRRRSPRSAATRPRGRPAKALGIDSSGRSSFGIVVAVRHRVGVRAARAQGLALLPRDRVARAVSEIVLEIIRRWDKFTGSCRRGGQLVGVEPIELFGWRRRTRAYRIFWVLLGALAFVLLIGIWLARAR